MGTYRWYCGPVLALFVLFFAMACGEDVVEGTNQGGGECPDGYTQNPITGQCVVAGTGGGGDVGDGSSGDGGGSGGGGGTGDGGSGDGTSGGDGGSGDGTGGGSTNPPEEQPCGNGAINGQACTPDQQTLPGANVSVSGVDCEGNPFEITTQADFNGNFSLDEVPAGDHELVVSQGSFSGVQIVRVFPGDTTDLSADGKKACLDGSGVPIAVLGGSYDDVGSLLRSLQIDFDSKGNDLLGISQAQSFLGDLDEMLRYQILFIECGGLWAALPGAFGGLFGGGVDMNVVKANIRQFVESGRSLYVSDQAYRFVNDIFPEAANFASNTLNGVGDQMITADVVSNEMLTLLGTNQADLYFNLAGWAVVESITAPSIAHFRGDANTGDGIMSDIPLLVSYTHPTNGGKVIYTSFHNSEQGNLGGDMEEVLRFLIFQL